MKNEFIVVLESLEHYNYFIKNLINKSYKYCYYVSNYELEEILIDRKENVFNILEIESNRNLNNDLCLKMHEVSDFITSNTSSLLINVENDYNFLESIERSLKTFLLGLSHKYNCFLNILEICKLENKNLIVLGDSKLSKENHISFDFNRYENLYLTFANFYQKNNVKVYDLANSNSNFKYYSQNVDKVNNRKFIEISTYWLFNNFSSIFFKLHKKLKINLLKFILIFRKRVNKKILIWNKNNYNDVMVSSYYDLVLNGAEINFYHYDWNKYVTDNNHYNKYKINNFEKFYKIVNHFNHDNLKKYFSNKDLSIFSKIIVNKFIEKYFRYKENKKYLEEQFEYLNTVFCNYDFVLINGFFRIEEKLMFRYIQKKHSNRNYKFVAFEHGLSYGIDKMHENFGSSYSMKYADIGVYMSKQSYKLAKSLNINKSILFSGFPKFYKKSLLDLFPSFLLKLLLGLNIFKKYIMIPMATQNNNFIYGPDYITDFQKEFYVHEIIKDLIKEYPTHQILLKKYPGQRFIDSSLNKRFKKNYKNIHIVDDVEMKAMKKLTDINISFYFSSTLGILAAYNPKLLVYEFFKGAKIINVSKNDVIRTKEFDKFFIKKNELYIEWDNNFINNIK